LVLGESKFAEAIVTSIATNACEYLDWYATLSSRLQKSSAQDILYNVYQLNLSLEILQDSKSENHEVFDQKFKVYSSLFSNYLY
jgi:hypothetical protein